MLLSKGNCSIAQLGSSDIETGRYDMDQVKIDPGTGYVYACNPDVIYASRLPTNESAKDFPSASYSDSVIGTHKEPDQVIFVPKHAIQKAEKNLPKKQTIGVLNYVNLLSNEHTHQLHATDLNKFDTVTVANRDSRVNWPSVANFYTEASNDKAQEPIILSLKNLETLVRVCKKHGLKTIEMQTISRNKPVKFRALDDSLYSYIMPYIT